MGGGGGQRRWKSIIRVSCDSPAVGSQLVGTEPRKVILKRCIIPVNETERASLRHAARKDPLDSRHTIQREKEIRERNVRVCV